MSDLDELRARYEALEADPPVMNESPAHTGQKLLAIARLLLDIAERNLED